MRPDGDHWPVIKATATSIMKDYEDWKIEHNVLDEVKTHFQSMIRELQALRDESPAKVRKEIDGTIISMLELYNASFSPVHEHDMYIDENNMPLHMKRAKNIVKLLEDGDAH
jgi:hypothetical protein